jgi:uncharacterized protein (TIGR02466 family)
MVTPLGRPRLCRTAFLRYRIAMESSTSPALIFATPIITETISHPGLDEALEKAILAQEAPSREANSTRGGWQTEHNFGSWGEAAGMLADHVFRLADTHTEMLDAGHEWTIEGWANILEPNGYNLQHTHGSSFWSAVYYVRVDEGSGGALTFIDPRRALIQAYSNRLRMKTAGIYGKAELKPKAGLLVMFPAWLDHAVQPWEGTGLRISVAMNLSRARRTGA